MAEEEQYTTGVFNRYIAVTKFHLGKIVKDIEVGEEVEFDGQTIKIAGASYVYSQVRASIRAGWLKKAGSVGIEYRPQSANIKVRPADGKSSVREHQPVVQDDMVEIRQVKKAATNNPMVSNEPPKFNRTVVKEEDISVVSNRIKAPLPKTASGSGAAGQEGVVLGQIRKASGQKITLDGKGPVPNPELELMRAREAAAAESRRAAAANIPKFSAVVADNRIHAAMAEDHRVLMAVLNDGADEDRDPYSNRVSSTVSRRNTNNDRAEAPTEQALAEQEEVEMSNEIVEVAPGVTWDRKVAWRTRARVAFDRYGNKPEILEAIKNCEIAAGAKSVADAIDAHIARAAASDAKKAAAAAAQAAVRAAKTSPKKSNATSV